MTITRGPEVTVERLPADMTAAEVRVLRADAARVRAQQVSA